jgi:hypothetical protein
MNQNLLVKLKIIQRIKLNKCLIVCKCFTMTTKFSKKKSSWWTISSIARLHDPSDRLLNSSFLHNSFVYEITNENFDMKEKRGHYWMTIQYSYIQEK